MARNFPWSIPCTAFHGSIAKQPNRLDVLPYWIYSCRYQWHIRHLAFEWLCHRCHHYSRNCLDRITYTSIWSFQPRKRTPYDSLSDDPGHFLSERRSEHLLKSQFRFIIVACSIYFQTYRCKSARCFCTVLNTSQHIFANFQEIWVSSSSIQIHHRLNQLCQKKKWPRKCVSIENIFGIYSNSHEKFHTGS